MGIRSWELGIGKQFLVVSQVNHSIVSYAQMSNVQLPMTIFTKATFFDWAVYQI